MKIYCNRCSKEMGEILKSKLRKGWVCLCKECNDRAKIAESVINMKDYDKSKLGYDFLRGLGF